MLSASGVTSRRTPPRGWAKARAYAELGKLQIVELWVGVPLAWSLLAGDDASAGRTFVLLALALVIEASTTSASLALDDVAGVRDGLDFANYGDADRYGVDKPLVSGRLTETDALRFAWGAIALAAAALVAALAVAAPFPWWLPLISGLVIVSALNYSVGARLSYVGGNELVTFAAMAATVALPYALVTAELPVLVLVQSLLVGLWMVQIAIFSNTQDRQGDRDASRLTVAARTSDRGNRRFIAAVFAISWTLVLGAVVGGLFPAWYLPLLAPAGALHALQLRAGLGGRWWLVARARGFWAFRLAVLGLFVANLIEGGA